MSFLKPNDVVLFQGDSVTDVGRSRTQDSEMGKGYPALIAPRFTAEHPEMNVRFLNRGISGNRVRDLKARWTEDCIALRPTVVSILIGVNDTWRRFDSNDPTSVADYARDYRTILERTRDELGARIILMDPFSLPSVPDRATADWRADLCPRIDAVRTLAWEFGARYIPLDALFSAASVHRPCTVWSADGVHPTLDGHALITDAWLREVAR